MIDCPEKGKLRVCVNGSGFPLRSNILIAGIPTREQAEFDRFLYSIVPAALPVAPCALMVTAKADGPHRKGIGGTLSIGAGVTFQGIEPAIVWIGSGFTCAAEDGDGVADSDREGFANSPVT
jgi:hypothetical protein